MFGIHDALDVFDDDNRIVDQEADRQHHGEHGQDIDGKAKGVQHGKGPQQYHRHGECWNDRRAEVLQKEVHHQEHQPHGLEQRMYHRTDRGADRRRSVVGINHLDARRQEGLKFGDGRAHGFHRFKLVGPRCKPQGNRGRRLAHIVAGNREIACAQADLGHVFQAHLRTVFLYFQQNLAEFLGRLEARLAQYGGGKLHARPGRQPPQLSGGNLHVLRTDGIDHILWHQLEAVEPGRIEPDTHRVGITEENEVANTPGTRHRVLQVGSHVVGKVVIAHGTIFGNHTDDEHEVGLILRHTDTLLLNFDRQGRHGQLEFVLYLHLGDIGIRSLLEGDDQHHAAVGVTFRGDVTQAVETVHFLFDDLRDGILHRLRRCARINRHDQHGGRCDIRILGDRQGADREQARQHDDDCHHPGKNRAIDEKLGHVISAP